MTKFRTTALALAGVLAIGALSMTSASAQWRHHGWGPGVAAGVAAGALIGSAVAAQPYGTYYDEPGYVYGAPYAYDSGPVYGTYGYRNYGYGKCYTDEGYGRRTPCDTSGSR